MCKRYLFVFGTKIKVSTSFAREQCSYFSRKGYDWLLHFHSILVWIEFLGNKPPNLSFYFEHMHGTFSSVLLCLFRNIYTLFHYILVYFV